MNEIFFIETPRSKKPRGYGLSNLVGDLVLTCCTFGLWAVWWFIREVRR